MKAISQQTLSTLLSIEDLSAKPNHAIHLMAKKVACALPQAIEPQWIYGSPIVQAAHNYHLLGYPKDSVVQESTYTQWVDSENILRTQTTSLITQELLCLADNPRPITCLPLGWCTGGMSAIAGTVPSPTKWTCRYS